MSRWSDVPMIQWPDGAPSPKFPLHPVGKRVTVALSDTLARRRERKTAMAETTGKNGRSRFGGSGRGR